MAVEFGLMWVPLESVLLDPDAPQQNQTGSVVIKTCLFWFSTTDCNCNSNKHNCFLHFKQQNNKVPLVYGEGAELKSGVFLSTPGSCLWQGYGLRGHLSNVGGLFLLAISDHQNQKNIKTNLVFGNDELKI